jgi:hypothetical protein
MASVPQPGATLGKFALVRQKNPIVLVGERLAPTSAMKETFNYVLKAIPLATVFALL